MALYNDVRPKVLSEIKGQTEVVKILKSSVIKNTLPNAALFVGTRGTGKTTMARILAKMVNCEQKGEDGEPCCVCDSCKSIQEGVSLDVIELDAASNNGVEDVRKMIGLLEYKTVGKMKVLILDEVHMLSCGAFNALLKVLEEPPKDVLFILCTTEAHKVPATILSRCRKFQFRSLELAEITSKLSEICAKYQVEAQESALHLIAKAANGSMRDAESIFEPFLLEKEVSEERVRLVLGLSSFDRVLTIIKSIKTGDINLAKASLDEATSKGENLMCLIEDLMNALLEMVSIRLSGDITDANPLLVELSHDFSESRLFELIAGLREVYEAKPGNLSISILSMIISLICTQSTVTRLENELEELKQAVGSGMIVSPSAADDIPPLPCEEGFERCEEATPFEDELPTKDYPEEISEKEKISVNPEALEALKAAGFVVDTGSTKEQVKEEQKTNDSPNVEETKDEVSDFFDSFAALFRM